jgi:hypothetical protein
MYDIESLLLKLQTNTEEAKKHIAESDNARAACIIAKSFLTAQSYGTILESWIKKHLSLNAKLDNLSGDASLKERSFEIKVSISDAKGGFNYVQLRPSHKIDGYIILNYSTDLDKVVWLYIPAEDMYTLINKHGGYAHGTLDVNGPITMESIKTGNFEYAIRPSILKPKTKPGKAWEDIKNYEVTEDGLRQILHST